MLRGPGNPQTATQFDISALPAPYNNPLVYSAGGQNKQSFYIYTGEKSTINQGATTRWYIDVSFNATGGGVAGDLPVTYGITCTSGNGTTVPWFLTTGTANP